jgi:uncharacterized phage-associated protein
MLDCLDVARYFIARAERDGRSSSMTNMKVQKLLYYAQSLYLALEDEVLFDAEIQAWRYGPVCPPVYRFYAEFEAQQLPIPAPQSFSGTFSSEQLQLLEEVWLHFGDRHAYMLSDITHLETPWKKARRGLPPDAASTAAIEIEDLKLLGQQKLDEIERSHPDYTPLMSGLLEKAFAQRESQPQYINPGEVRDWLTSLLD